MGILTLGPYQRVQATMGGALFPPYFPLTLPGLEEYYDARSPLGIGAAGYANGANVDPWADLSGHSPTRDMAYDGLFAIGQIRPTYLASAFPKGAGAVRFNGANNALVTGTLNPVPAATNGHSFHAYGDFRGTAAPPAPFAGAIVWMTDVMSAVPKELLLQTVGTSLAGWRDNAGFHLDGSRPNGKHLLSWVFTPPNTGVFYVDGVAALTTTYGFAGAAVTATGLSDYVNGNVPLNADLGFVFWCSRAHSAATIAQTYLWSQIFFGY